MPVKAPAGASLSARSDPGSLVDPLFLLREVWAAKWLIVLITLLGIALSVLIALNMPHKYTAVTQVLIDPRDLKVVQNEVTPNGLPGDATLALIESQMSIIYSNDVLGAVAKKADLAKDPEFNGETKSVLSPILSFFAKPEDADALRRRDLVTLAALRKSIDVSRDPKTFVINIALTTRDPDKSARLANLLADAFIDQIARVQSDTAKRASDALSSRLAELRQKVVDAEQAVEAYKQKYRLVGVGGRLVDDDYIVRINDQLARARGETTTLRVRAEQMKNASVDDVVKGTLPEELTSDTLNRLRTTYSELAQRRATLAATLGPRHPRLIAAEDALQSARQAIKQELQRIVSAAQTELARAERTDKELTAQVNGLKDKQLQTSADFVKLRELEREVDASRAVYEAFLLRARETGEQERLNTANVRIISSATPPLSPSSTSRKLIVIVGVIGGFLVGLGLAVLAALIKMLRRTLRQPEQTDLWREEAERTENEVAARTVRSGAAADDVAQAVRPTVDTPVERTTREERRGPFRSRDRMAGRVSRAEEALAARLPESGLAAPDAGSAGDRSDRAPIAGPSRAARRSPADREALRQKLRAIAEEAETDDGAGDRPVYNEDIARLQQDIQAVKRNLMDARNRRNP
ncbi:GumC family protein [Jiella sp. MQZ9-1]|uniref:GumC family protein n=1 Tax=Jiella flava TaxID=2816857 RepID=A0A939FU75_9HYPH|nr:GumC family protein [Jiella flava]MCD2470274.1 GumC family protein [Jiella flava]